MIKLLVVPVLMAILSASPVKKASVPPDYDALQAIVEATEQRDPGAHVQALYAREYNDNVAIIVIRVKNVSVGELLLWDADKAKWVPDAMLLPHRVSK